MTIQSKQVFDSYDLILNLSKMCLVTALFRVCKFILKWPVLLVFDCLCFICPPFRMLCSWLSSIDWMKYIGFLGGYALGQLYYVYLLKHIPFPYGIGSFLSLSIKLFWGIGNAICRQLRCISLLALPMYCGKPGRSVLKAVVLTHVIAGPISNMGLNAKEVVRVFACSTQLSSNLSKAKYSVLVDPFKKAAFELNNNIDVVKDVLRSVPDLVSPIESEVEDTREESMRRDVNDYIDDVFADVHRSDAIEQKYEIKPEDTEKEKYQKMYLKKLEYRCQDQLSRAVALCIKAFEGSFMNCYESMPQYAAWALCWPVKITYICNFMHIVGGTDICDSRTQAIPGLSEGYIYLEKAKQEITRNFDDVKIQYEINNIKNLTDIQDAKETGERVMHAFEEKHIIMQKVIDTLNVCVALLFLRIILAAGTYHDLYLTSIGHDNVYITGYFKKIDKRRSGRNQVTLLPLKKMERSKYIDVLSTAYTAERNKIMTQVLKVMLEMVTATTFVMLDRLFYEALDVVRQHAETEGSQHGEQDLEIKVEGTGFLADVVRKILSGLTTHDRIRRLVTNRPCLPRPRCMPPIFFLKIYGGYVWILLLLYFNPYTLRLRRLFCSWFYPRREKQRILHLYNDILKKRLKMQKTLRRKAVQAIRAHYLSAENLLSLRIKFPQMLGWLKLFPAARMTCLICGETEPRNASKNDWHMTCASEKCPFVYCDECWREVGERCLACDPSLVELSDVDSLSDDDQPRY